MNQSKANNTADLGYAIVFQPSFEFLINAQTGTRETAAQAAARLLDVKAPHSLAPLKAIIIRKILVQPLIEGQARPDLIATFGPNEIPDVKRLDAIGRMRDLILLEFRNSQAITAI
jgi:hypothetical protein